MDTMGAVALLLLLLLDQPLWLVNATLSKSSKPPAEKPAQKPPSNTAPGVAKVGTAVSFAYGYR